MVSNERQICRDRKQINSCLRLEVGMGIHHRQAQGNLRCGKKNLSWMVVMVVQLYNFTKTHRLNSIGEFDAI